MSSAGRIARIETFVVKIPTHDRFGGQINEPETFPASDYYFERAWREVYATGVQSTLLRIETDDGLVGWGECQSPIVPEVTASIIDNLLGPMLLGRNAAAIDELSELMYGSMNVRGHFTGFMVDAIAGVDIALWDIAGRRASESIAALAGGVLRPRLSSYVSGLRAGTTEARIDVARRSYAEGYSAVKLYLGRGVDADIEEAAALRRALGPEARMSADLFWIYSLRDAVRLGQALQELGVEWIESPLAPEDRTSHRELCRSLEIAVAVGEPLRAPHQFADWLADEALDVAQPDVGRCGITFARRIAGLAAAAGRPVAFHVGVCLGVVVAATWQLAACTEGFHIQEQQPPVLDIANRFLETPLEMERGEAVVPAGPGLGIDVSREAVMRSSVAATEITAAGPRRLVDPR